jgi:4-amino-4-deoxy-L-arabinose transferase-like glycosyltransferase
LVNRKTVFWVLLATGLGAALRLAAIGSVPVGLYQDEAYNGLDGLRVLSGTHPLYFSANNGREPLFIYLASASIAGLGRTVAAVRLPAALLGTLTIPATAALGSALFNRRVGLLAATLVAITFWPLHLSRVAFRAVGLPLFVALALAAGWHGARQGNRAWILAGGVLYGLGFYTYLPIYFTPLILALFAIYLWATGHRAGLRRSVPWFVSGAALSVAPLALTTLADPSLLLARMGQVSILESAASQGELWGTLFRQIGRSLGMFFLQGDMIPRHNLPGRPVFDWLMAPFLLIGVIWAGRNWRRPAAVMTLLWTLVMLGPTILAEGAPHYLRAVGVLPVVFLLPAVGLERGERWLARSVPPTRIKMVPLAMTGLLLAASLAITIRDYYGRYAADPLTRYAFQDAAVELAEEINNYAGPVWADDRFAGKWEAIPYLVGEREVHWLAEGERPQITDAPAALFLWPHEPIAPQIAALPIGISVQGTIGPLAKGDLEPAAYPLYWAYWLEPAPHIQESPLAHFDDNMRLETAMVADQTTSTGDAVLQVTLYWTAEERPGTEYVAFVHLVGATGMVAQDDSIPATGTLPTSWWRPGIWIVDVHQVPMPPTHTREDLKVAVGLYRSDNQERLAVLNPTGRPIDDVVILP